MVKFSVKLSIVFFFAAFAQCEHSNSGSNSNSVGSAVVKPLETTLKKTSPDPIQSLLVQFFKLLIKPDQKSEMNFRQTEDDKYQGEQIAAKQLNVVLPTLPPFFEKIRSYFKMAYKTYLLMNAEVKFGQCIVKYLYTEYPSVMRFFRMENFSNFARRLYIVVGKFMNNIINTNIFSWPETEFDRKRIGMKVAMTATEQRSPRPNVNLYETYSFPELVLHYNNNLNSFGTNVPRGQVEYRARFVRQAQISDSNNVPPTGSNKGKTIEKTKSKEMIQSYADIDSEARIDLTNRDLEREAENLFNIDSMFWRSLGIEENSFKRYSLAYCTKEYVTESFKRFMKNVILS